MSLIKITDSNGQQVKGCCVMYYKDWVISISTIGQMPEIACWKRDDTSKTLLDVFGCADELKATFKRIDRRVKS